MENIAQLSTVPAVVADPRMPREEATLVSRILPAASKGSLATLGQGLFAGANFVANVLLARWLTPDQYGAFALAYSCFLLFLMLYSACIYEPLIVFGSGKYAIRFQEYFAVLVRLNSYVLAGLGGLMLAASFLLGSFFPAGVKRDFMALSVAAPFILLTWLGRGGFYARVKPGPAASGASIYFAILLLALAVLRLEHRLSGSTAFLGMGLAGIVSTLYLFWQLGLGWKISHDSPALSQVTREHWGYGRWALAAALASWFPQNIYYSILPAKMGLEGTAGLRALTNLTNPLLQTLTALAAVLIPSLVLQHHRGGIARVQKTLRTMMLVLVPGSVVYCAALWLGRPVLFKWLYSGKYQQYDGWPLLFTVLAPIGATAAMIAGSALRALQKPERVFWAYAAATAPAVVIGLPLTVYGGVTGATLALLISSVAGAVAMIWSFLRLVANDAQEVL